MALTSEETEGLVALVSCLREALTAVEAGLNGLAPILRAEQDALAEGRMAGVEAIAQTKERTGEDLVALGHHAQACAVRLAEGFARYFPSLTWDGSILSALMDQVTVAVDGLATESLGSQVLRHGVKALRKAFDELVATRDRSSLLVSQNRYLIARAQEYHQESLRFWQSLCEESLVPYDAQGVRKAKGMGSLFATRA